MAERSLDQLSGQRRPRWRKSARRGRKAMRAQYAGQRMVTFVRAGAGRETIVDCKACQAQLIFRNRRVGSGGVTDAALKRERKRTRTRAKLEQRPHERAPGALRKAKSEPQITERIRSEIAGSDGLSRGIRVNH